MTKSFFIVIGLLLVSCFSQAQKQPSIRSSVTKNRVLLGEPFQLVIEADIPGGSIVRPVQIDTIPHFEFLQPPAFDTIREASGIKIKAVYHLTSFDSGHWVIPSFFLSARIRTDTLPIDVVFSEFDPEQPYHDIKDIVAVDEEKSGSPWWYWAAGGAVLLIIGAVLLLRKRKAPVKEQQSEKDAYRHALDELDKLKKGNAPATEYYSQLVSIFRQYVFRRRGIQSMQKTTNDLAVKLQSLKPGTNAFDRLVQALRLSDFVKFAKYRPSDEDNADAWEAVRNGIEELEKLN